MARRVSRRQDEIDEDPSPEDIEAFGDVTTTCPNCRATLYDDVAICWKCGEAQGAARKSAYGKPWVIVVAVLLAAVMVLGITGRLFF